jgi:C4-dicarboxylate transporter, DctQ subunit
VRVVNAWLYRFEDAVVGVALGFATVATFFEVVARYVFHASVGTGGEVAVFSIIWAAMIGAAVAARSGVHIGVDVLVKKLPPVLAKAMVLLTLLVSAGFTLIVAVLGVELVTLSLGSGQVTAELLIPRWMLYCSVPIGMILMTYHLLHQFAGQLRMPAEEVVAAMGTGHGAEPEPTMLDAEMEAGTPKAAEAEAARTAEAARWEEVRP